MDLLTRCLEGLINLHSGTSMPKSGEVHVIRYVTETLVPTVLRIGPYRLFFYSADGSEPPHVHVARDDAVAKYWLDPVQYDHSLGFRPAELRKIQRIIAERQTDLLEAWNEFFRQ